VDTNEGTTRHELKARRTGLILFAFYCVLYAGFIGLSTFCPKILALRPFGGINVAILYGFALIVAALVLACIYMWCARSKEGQT
jgi:uncharacterized membrane protein (DUF485 family)